MTHMHGDHVLGLVGMMCVVSQARAAIAAQSQTKESVGGEGAGSHSNGIGNGVAAKERRLQEKSHSLNGMTLMFHAVRRLRFSVFSPVCLSMH